MFQVNRGVLIALLGLEGSRVSDQSLVIEDMTPLDVFLQLLGFNNDSQYFPADTKTPLSDGREKAIADITTSDKVAAFHPSNFAGRGGLEGQSVVRLFENVTDTWVQLSNGMTVTPGHHFLDAKGNFRTISDILATDSQIVLADGTLAKVTGEYIHYSEETADMFEQAEGYFAQPAANGSLAPALTHKKGWKTYNFEVAEFNIYVKLGANDNKNKIIYRKAA